MSDWPKERPLGVLLAHAAAAYRQAMTQRLKDEQWLVDAGFRPPCIGALSTIATRQPLSQRELSDQLRVDPSDIVSVVDILERAGFVSRERDPNDRRRQALTLTPHGEKAVKRLRLVLDGVDDQVLGPMGAQDRNTLRRLLEGVVSYDI